MSRSSINTQLQQAITQGFNEASTAQSARDTSVNMLTEGLDLLKKEADLKGKLRYTKKVKPNGEALFRLKLGHMNLGSAEVSPDGNVRARDHDGGSWYRYQQDVHPAAYAVQKFAEKAHKRMPEVENAGLHNRVGYRLRKALDSVF